MDFDNQSMTLEEAITIIREIDPTAEETNSRRAETIILQVIHDGAQVVQSVVVTNADRIRSMSDEELAIEETAKGGCPHDCETPDDLDTDCVRCWLDWLKQGVDNG